MNEKSVKGGKGRKPGIGTSSVEKAATTRAVKRSFGSLSQKMKDHVYYLVNGYIYTTPCITSKMHMKFYAAILLAVDRKPFAIRMNGEEKAYTALVMKPGTKFVFDAADIEFVCIFVEPTHRSFGNFRSVPPAGLPLDREAFAKLDGLLDEAYRGSLSRAHAVRVFEDVIRLACETLGLQSVVDARVAKALRVMSTSAEASLDELARAVGLSYYRLSHLFAENLGITLRQFLQWKKVTVTASLLMIKSITEVAHDAGFSDSAHLSRTFQDIFGVSPSYLLDSNCVERFFYL